MLTIPHDAPGIDKLVDATGIFTPWRHLPDGSLALDGLTYIKLTMLTLNFSPAGASIAAMAMNPTLFSALPSVALTRMALLFDQGLLSSPCTTRAQWEARVGNAALKCAPGNVAGVPSLPALDITDFYQHHTAANDVPDAAWFTTTPTFGMMSDKDGVP